MFEVKIRIFKKSGKFFNDLIKLITNYQSTFSTGVSFKISILVLGILSLGTIAGPGKPSVVLTGVTPST
jgi:hypothetical protein